MPSHFATNRNPIICTGGANFTIEHILSCAKGGYSSICHNEIRDFTANLMAVVCHNVATEHHLQTGVLTCIYQQTRGCQTRRWLLMRMGSRFERAFFDIRVFNPFALSNKQPLLSSTYQTMRKKRNEPMSCKSGTSSMPHSPLSIYPAQGA